MTLSTRLAHKLRHTKPAKSESSPVAVSPKNLIAIRREAKGFYLRPSRIYSAQAGKYISPHIGRGMTFAESRLYQPGDDVRHIDWRVTARTGKAHTKLFQEERERSILVWVDLSATMFFATRGRFKSVQAASIAAWIAWAANYNKDRVGGVIFSEHAHWELRPRTGDKAVLRLIHALSEGATFNARQIDGHNSNPQNSSTQAMVRLRRVVKPGSQIFLLSDFRNLEQTTKAHIQQLARHNELVLISIHDPLEQSLPMPGLYPVDFGQGNQILNSANKESRQHYAAQFKTRQDNLENLSRKLACYLLTISTQDDAIANLQSAFQS